MLEVLAPVGNIQALKAAIYAGADAVYLGLDLFNARIKADNFNKDNIAYWVDYCHLFGVKVYLTFNTNIKQSEREIFAQYVDISAKAGVDAFIVTDLGCLDILKKYDIPLHGSTQIGVHNLAGAKVLEDLGFTRVVLARETLDCDIAEIRKNTRLEIEHFVHGALCVCFSGACLMSSMMSGDSGNRGRCNQPCRLKYSSSFSSKESYLLSPKDQCLIDKVGELSKLGVDSLKIEGRLKQPHYVGEVVAQYRRAVDSFLLGNDDEIDYNALKTAYNRGDFTLGYNYQGSKDIMYDKVNSNIGLEVGKVLAISKCAATLELNRELNKGDGVKIIYDGKEVGGLAITNIEKIGRNYKVKDFGNYPIGSSVHLTLDSKQVDKYKNVNPKLSIKLQFTAKLGEKTSLIASYRDIQIEVNGEAPQSSISQSANYDSVAKQLLRLGDSIFSAELDVIIDDNLFIPASLLNNLRRSAVEKLNQEILKVYDLHKQRVGYSDALDCYYDKNNNVNKNIVFVEIDVNNDSLEALSNLEQKFNLAVNFTDYMANFDEIFTKTYLIEKTIENIYLKLPRVARGRDYKIIDNWLANNLDKFDGILADNLYGVFLAKKYGKSLIGGIGLNVFNSNYADCVGLDYYINSVELTNKEAVGGMAYAYGKLPIMTLLHCPVQINTGCNCGNCKYSGKFSYFDKRGEYEIERIKVANCQFILLNQQIVDIRNKISIIDGNYYINLHDCNGDQISSILDNFCKKSGNSVDNSTYGHLFRGVK
ncbi:MAG: U32 family peptidase [Clostridia bacterium]|nr:U32 family peptidase [Clostridia bacterium]